MVGGSSQLHAAVAFQTETDRAAKQESFSTGWVFTARPEEKPILRPEIRQDYPLNLSISISGGKETNQDSPSNGE